MDRAIRVPVAADYEACFAAPEDVILKKLEFHQMGGGDRHLRDIAGVVKIRGEQLDCLYIATWAAKLGVADIWQAILDRMDEG